MNESNVARFRPIDPVIDQRISQIQRELSRAESIVELVERFLADNCEQNVGDTSAVVLADALTMARRGLQDVWDRLDLVNLRQPADCTVIRSSAAG